MCRISCTLGISDVLQFWNLNPKFKDRTQLEYKNLTAISRLRKSIIHGGHKY